MKSLLWLSLILVIIIAFDETFWGSRSEEAWLIQGLAIAIGFQAVYLLIKKK